MTTFRKVVLFTDRDGRAKFRDEDVALTEGRSLVEAGPFASAAAALATTVLGAQASLPRRGAVLALLEAQRRASR